MRADVVADVARAEKVRHMAIYEAVTYPTHVHVRDNMLIRHDKT